MKQTQYFAKRTQPTSRKTSKLKNIADIKYGFFLFLLSFCPAVMPFLPFPSMSKQKEQEKPTPYCV